MRRLRHGESAAVLLALLIDRDRVVRIGGPARRADRRIVVGIALLQAEEVVVGVGDQFQPVGVLMAVSGRR